MVYIEQALLFFKWAKPGHFFGYFRSFLTLQDDCSARNDKSIGMELHGIGGVLGTRTRGGRMESADESNEPWRHPYTTSCTVKKVSFDAHLLAQEFDFESGVAVLGHVARRFRPVSRALAHAAFRQSAQHDDGRTLSLETRD